MDFDLKKTALVLLHFQRDICMPEGRLAPDDPDALGRYAVAIDRAKVLLEVARRSRVSVIHSAFGRKRDGNFANRHGRMLAWIYQADGCIEGEDGHSFVEQLMPNPDEAVVRGAGLSAFGDSRFAEILALSEIETLFVTGITTHWAVEGTVRVASDFGYDCFVVSDCVASAVVENHESALERLAFIAKLSNSEEVIGALTRRSDA